MSPTLLEFAIIVVLIIAAWQIGLAIAPAILRWFRTLKRDVDEAADQALHDPDHDTLSHQNKKEHTNGTPRQ
jgi:hypothetical protein